MDESTGSAGSGTKVLIVGTGAIGVALLPGWVLWFRFSLGWDCRVLLTDSAASLVSSEALAALSRHPVERSHRTDGSVAHRELADWADMVIVAPATANTIAKLSVGIADDLASSVIAYAECPTIVVPSIPGPASRSAVYTRALAQLEADGKLILPTGIGVSAWDGAAEVGGMPSVLDLRAFLVARGLLVDGR
jgi:phosphopantothenoylcysteine decarboxylase / phosphopantothenate---cysteine ligase